jgi:hypothetical protein
MYRKESTKGTMETFIDKLLAGRNQRSDAELVWELGQALDDKRDRGEILSAAEILAWQACSVCRCDGIGDLVGSRDADIAATAAFASQRGLPETARVLADAARGVPVPGPVSVSATVSGKTIDVPLEPGTWGATDLTLSLNGEDLDAAIIDLLAEQRDRFDLTAPVGVQARENMAQRVADLAAGGSAAALLQRFGEHGKARLRARVSEYDCEGSDADWLELPVTHQLGDPPDAARIAELRARHGDAAADLLDVYAAHDGAALFVAGEEAGFYLVPLAQWPEHIECVMDWAREVTWGQEPEELPDYLESAIPFGYTPGDSERWILVTRGAHAGAVMLSDTDVIDDQQRYASIAEFLAALLLDTENVLGNGGYVSYSDGASDKMYYPMQYLY